MATSSNLISTVPNGTLPTITALKAVDVSTVQESSTATVLGNAAAGDGGGGKYYYVAGSSLAASAASDKNPLVVAPNASTGRWIRASDEVNSYTGRALPVVSALTYSGAKDQVVILSGTASLANVNFFFPPSASRHGQKLTIKMISTGTVNLYATGVDELFDTGPIASITSTLVTGQVWNFFAVTGRWYRIDPKEIM